MPTKAQSGELIDIRPLGDALAQTKHTSLLETDSFKIKRMVLPAGKELPEHKAPAEIIVQCLEGRFEFTALGKANELLPGHMIYLTTGQLHSVRAIEDSSFLLTMIG